MPLNKGIRARLVPSKGRSPGTRRVYRYDWFPPGPPNLKIPLGPALPSLLGPRETIPSLQSRMLPPPTTKWHFKEKWQLVADACSDPPCVSAGRLLFACFSVTRPSSVGTGWAFGGCGHRSLPREEAGCLRSALPLARAGTSSPLCRSSALPSRSVVWKSQSYLSCWTCASP